MYVCVCVFFCLLCRYACDMEVVGMMRERSLGNSCTQLYRKIAEQHHLNWLQRGIDYMSVCEPFKARQPDLVIPELPSQPEVPQPRWLMSVYLRDVMSRADDVKDKLTSTFGSILKVDSTKKLAKKLAGDVFRSAQWVTDVGNEYGQVLTCVLTTAEGTGLEAMGCGLVRRYKEAHVDPPKVLYVDRECCGPAAGRLSPGWNNNQIRLDIWHLMRRFARGVIAESHQLYAVFMSRLSACIFEWEQEDVNNLCRARAAELECDESTARCLLTRKQLALHCRHQTRGAEDTIKLIDELIESLRGDKGLDTLGMPLFDQPLMDHIWSVEKKHIHCIQDPVGIQLYIQTGTVKRGGVDLPTYRCSRGSVSLESFHLHITRFVPGMWLLGMVVMHYGAFSVHK